MKGFMLMAALFLIVTLAAIGLYLVTVSTGQIEAASQDEQGARAYQAARTGIDWAAFQLLRNSGGTFATSTCTTSPAAAGSQTVPLNTLGAPAGATAFAVTVTCSRKTDNDAGANVDVFTLVATGCNATSCPKANPDQTYVERQLQLILTK
jgi:MSHA biogenesis protein MshP